MAAAIHSQSASYPQLSSSLCAASSSLARMPQVLSEPFERKEASKISSPVEQLHVSRRKLRGELEALKKLINDSQLKDEKTIEIKTWTDRFLHSLRFADEKETKRKFIAVLLESFKDPIVFIPAVVDSLLGEAGIDYARRPIADIPFDETALLGSDGITYARSSYELYSACVSKELQRRSPFRPDDPTVFTTQPHHIVTHVASWLRNEGISLRSDTMEKKHKELFEGKTAPIILTLATERRRRLLESEAENEQLNQAAVEKAFADVSARIEEATDEALAPARAEIKKVEDEALAGLKADGYWLKKQADQLLAAADNLGAKAEEIKKDTQRLGDNLQKMGSTLAQEEIKTAQLKIEVNAVEKAVKENKSKQLKSLAQSVAIIAASIIVGYGIEQLLSQGPVSGGVTAAKGGARLDAFLRFK